MRHYAKCISQHQSASVTGNQQQSGPVSICATSASSSFWSLFVLNLEKFTPDRICLPTPSVASVTNIRYVCGECVASSCAIINHHLPPSCQTHTDGFLIFEFHHFNLFPFCLIHITLYMIWLEVIPRCTTMYLC